MVVMVMLMMMVMVMMIMMMMMMMVIQEDCKNPVRSTPRPPQGSPLA